MPPGARPAPGTTIRLDARVKAARELSWSQARSLIETGKVFLEGRCVRDPGHEVAMDAAFEVRMNAPRGGAASLRNSADFRRVFEDPHLIVVEKPSGISSVPFERKGAARELDRRPRPGGRPEGQEESTLLGHLEAQLRQKLFVVQRLDRETSGLIVFARTMEASRGLAQQFRFHTIHRRYLALVHGKVRETATFKSPIASDRGDGLRGAPLPGVRVSAEDLKAATTHVRRLAVLQVRGATLQAQDFTKGESEGAMSLIECRLETGRTHQIRIHLAEVGHPLVGDALYQRDFRGTPIPAERILLHAAELGLRHPVKEGLDLQWKSPLPADFRLDFEWAARHGVDPGWFREFVPASPFPER